MQWVQLLDDSGIDYVTKGPNTKRGEISVRCPWCGEQDPSMHLGIGENGWGCLRDATHRGRSSITLIAALLNCTTARAKLIEAQYSTTDPEDLNGAIAALEGLPEAPRTAPETYPAYEKIRYSGPTQRFWNYIKNRGFGDEVKEVIWRYDLKCCLHGRFKDRIIIPFRRLGKIIAWTGRAITDPVAAPRYLSSNLIKTTLFNEDAVLRGGKLLFITEGPFDALKVGFYGGGRVVATCTSGTALSTEQINLLNRAVKQFNRVIVLFDHDAMAQAFATMDWLCAHNVVVGQLPPGVKDPGALNPSQINRLIQEFAHEP